MQKQIIYFLTFMIAIITINQLFMWYKKDNKPYQAKDCHFKKTNDNIDIFTCKIDGEDIDVPYQKDCIK